jgi:glycosyltransferase involved in cell wall biosynthesis
VLIRAAARLSVPFHLDIIGEGPEREKLSTAVMSAGLTNQVTFCGARTHDELPHHYAQAHVVVVPSIEDTTGDRDGLPNVVLEALASGRPVAASDVGAISSAIIHQENGLLVPAGNAPALTEALETLARQPALREQLSSAGRLHVEREYELGRCTERLRRVLARIYA